MQDPRTKHANNVQFVHDKLAFAFGEDSNKKHMVELRELIGELRKPRLTLPNELLEAGDWQKVTYAQIVGISSTGWRLVFDALVAALRGRSVQYFDKPFVMSMWVKPGSDMYAASGEAVKQ